MASRRSVLAAMDDPAVAIGRAPAIVPAAAIVPAIGLAAVIGREPKAVIGRAPRAADSGKMSARAAPVRKKPQPSVAATSQPFLQGS